MEKSSECLNCAKTYLFDQGFVTFVRNFINCNFCTCCDEKFRKNKFHADRIFLVRSVESFEWFLGNFSKCVITKIPFQIHVE